VRLVLFYISLSALWLINCAAPEVSGAEFPFEFREGLLWVNVQVPESKRALNFLVDSGAAASVINMETAKELGLPIGQKAEVLGVGVSMDAFWTTVNSAKANEVNLPNRVLALDLGKLSRSCERRVDGLIGADFFIDKSVQIDFRESKVRLCASGTEVVGDVAPLVVRRGGLRVKASIDGQKNRWFRVDTGCATPLQWVTADVNPKDSTRKVAVGLTELAIPQTRTKVKIGNELLMDVETGLHSSAIFNGEAGLVGNGLLNQFETVTIDASARKLVMGRRLAPVKN
jgi:predicted aspartyl protease